jgi:hypothetical protein
MPSTDTDKNVYILGAGFSKELGLPLQNDFLLKSKDVYFRKPEQYKHFDTVFKYQDTLSRMSKFLSYPLLNLEQLFNLVEMDLFFSGDKDLVEIKNDFVNLITDTLAELTPNPFHHDSAGKLQLDRASYDSYLRFFDMFVVRDANVKNLLIPRNDTIISFNYDLVFETTAYIYNWINNKSNPGRGFPHGITNAISLNVIFGKENIEVENIGNIFKKITGSSWFPTYDIFSDHVQAIKLIKLHGSINWKSIKDGKRFIVPPSWNKSDPEVQKLWNIACEELTNAKRIIIIGYSFPETDTYVKSLLAIALNKNKILQNIYFINPNKDRVQEACTSLLDRHFQDHCEYKPWSFFDLINTTEGHIFIKSNLNRQM